MNMHLFAAGAHSCMNEWGTFVHFSMYDALIFIYCHRTMVRNYKRKGTRSGVPDETAMTLAIREVLGSFKDIRKESNRRNGKD